MPTDNLALATLEQAARQPEAPAFVMSGRIITYDRTAALVVNFARRMQELGVSRKSIVALSIQSMPTATIASLAVALLGSRWVWTEQSPYDATHIFASTQGALPRGAIGIDRSWYDAPPVPTGVLPFTGHSSPEDIWMTAASSGTTGASKYMHITYGNLWRRVLIPETQESAPVICNLFPALSAHGARVNVGNLVTGGANASRAPWEKLLDLGVTRLTGSPSQVSGVLFKRAPTERRIHSVKVAGAHVTRKFVETALRYAEEVHLAYGATEVGAVARATITHIDQFDGSIGQANEGASFEVVDEMDRPVAAGNEGEVRVRTGWMVGGYVYEKALTARTFRGGWFHPGDLGFLDARGALHITGRANDVLNVGGVKFNAAALDEIIQQHPSVVDGYCFVRVDANGTDTLGAVVELIADTDTASLGTLNSIINSQLGQRITVRFAYIFDTLPRNDSGKPVRRHAADITLRMDPVELPPVSP